jgi:aryl-alcohol dehydrogenase-like predicted oxidoreductase
LLIIRRRTPCGARRRFSDGFAGAILDFSDVVSDIGQSSLLPLKIATEHFMKYRILGQGLKVSSIGIGCMPMIHEGNITYGKVDLGVAERTIHEAIDLGITFFDTAELYGPFTNEELVGRAIKGRREGLVIATKFAMRWDGNRAAGLDGSPANARRACEASLKRLGIDSIDLFYQHRVDPNVPIEETVGGLAELSKEGKIRHIGLSEAAPETIRRAAKVHPIAALQTEYSVWERDVEAEILPSCRALGIGFVPYSPLGRGFLAGTIKSLADLPASDWRHNDPRYSDQNLPKNLAIVDVISGIAKKNDVSNAQVALAWLLAQGDDVVPIPGVKRSETMTDSAKAPDVALSEADIAALAAAAPHGRTAGARYAAAGMATVRK